MRDVTGNVIAPTIVPPTMVNGVPSLAGFPDNGTKLGELDVYLWQYTEGLVSNMAVAKKNGGLMNDGVLIGALQSITGPVPGLGTALTAAKQLQALVNTTFGEGSVAGRFLNAVFSGNLITNPIETIGQLFSGRTYRYDQYQLAVAYSYHVLGKDLADTNHASDALVIEACKWFIDRLGVFINGLDSLRTLVVDKSAVEYMQRVNICPMITIDINRVNAALQVTGQYMPDGGSIGNWAGTIGVYDKELVALAQQGYNDYYGNLNALKQESASGNTSFLNNVIGTSTGSKTVLYVAIAIVLIIIIIIISRK